CRAQEEQDGKRRIAICSAAAVPTAVLLAPKQEFVALVVPLWVVTPIAVEVFLKALITLERIKKVIVVVFLAELEILVHPRMGVLDGLCQVRKIRALRTNGLLFGG